MFNKLQDKSAIKLLAISISAIAFIYVSQVLLSFFSNFSDIIILLVLSWLISFVVEPLIEYLQKWGVNRIISTSLVFIVFTLAIFWLILTTLPVLINQINALAIILPSYLTQVPGWANRVADLFLSTLNNSVLVIQKFASLLFYIFFVLMLSFYFILDKEKFWAGFLVLLPKSWRQEADFLKNVVDKSFANFLRAQVVFGLIFGTFTLLLLLFLNPTFALLGGFLSGFFTMLPIIGPLLALIPPFIILLPFGLSPALWLTLVLFVFQQVEFNILGPKIIGKTMRLHPAWVLVAFLLGFKIAGVWGSVFAIPLASIINLIAAELLPHFLNRTD